jgi:FMN-dependent NADH-azoreductase
MAHLHRIDASIRQDGSFTRSVADTFQAAWEETHPTGLVTVRDLGRDPLPYLTQADHTARHTPEAERSPEQLAAVARSTALVDELLDADAVLLGVPLYNWGTPASVKTWIDHLFSDPRTRDPEGLFRGRTLVLINAQGGSYKPGTPRDGWDHAEPYLSRILGEVFGFELQVITPELTLAEVVPAMAELIDTHKASLSEAHTGAETAGRDLARQLTTVAA